MPSMKKAAILGMSWAAIEKVISRIVVFVLGIILARKLLPSDYGVFGMLDIFIAIAATLTDSGLGSALIQKKDKTNVDYSTFFIFNFGVSALLYLVLFFAAPWIASFYNTPILKDVTRVVALQLVLNALFNTQFTKLRVDLRFKDLSLIAIVSQILTGIVAIVLAYMGFGVWALVFQVLLGSILRGLLVMRALHWWTPGTRFSNSSFKGLFGFGSKILASSLINTIYGNLYTLIIGKAYSADEVGHFNRGSSLAVFPSNALTDIVVSVNYPILSRLQDDNDKLISAYRKMLTLPLFILYPTIIGLGVLAEPVVGLLLKEQWLPCVPFLQIMCLGTIFTPLTHINLNLLYVKGRSDLVLKLELIKKPIGFALIFISMQFGIMWLMAGKALYEFIAFSINCFYTGKILGYGWKEQMADITPIILKAVLMGVAVYFICSPLSGWWTKLLVGAAAGIIVYAVIAVVTRDKNFKEIISLLKEFRKG